MKPEILNQVRIPLGPNCWFTVEDRYLDLGCDGLTISYWEMNEGKEQRRDYLCIDGEAALAIADAIYKLFKKENQ